MVILSILLISTFANATPILTLDESNSYFYDCKNFDSYSKCQADRMSPTPTVIREPIKNFESSEVYEGKVFIFQIKLKKMSSSLNVPKEYILQIKNGLEDPVLYDEDYKEICNRPECNIWTTGEEHNLDSFTIEISGKIPRPIDKYKDNPEVISGKNIVEGLGLGRKNKDLLVFMIYEADENLNPIKEIQEVDKLNVEVTNKILEDCFKEIEENCNLQELDGNKNLNSRYSKLINDLKEQCNEIKELSENGRPGWAVMLSRNVKKIKQEVLDAELPCPAGQTCHPPCPPSCPEGQFCQKECSKAPWIFAIILGVVGVVIGYLFAPKKDEDEENKLKKKLKDVDDGLNEKKKDIEKIANEIASKDTNASIKLKGVCRGIDNIKEIIR